MKINESLIKLLPYGYSFLVILGIIKQSVFYYQIDINILHFSNIMDILISPIADIVSNPVILIACTTILILIYFMVFLLSRNYNKKWVKKYFVPKNARTEWTEEIAQKRFGNMFLAYFAIGLLSFYLGIGMGNGAKVSQKIAKNDLKYDHILTHNSNEPKEIYLIGSNSANYFYVEKGNKNVKISPVVSIKSLEFSNNKKLNKKK